MSEQSGSIWRKWDLHIHTPETVLNNQFEGKDIDEKWEKYLDRVEEIGDVSVLGITDYFSLDGYKRMVQFKESGRLDNISLLIPNVELRIVPVTSDPTAINYHFMFSPEIVDRLESIFFTELKFSYDANIYKCVKKDLINLGKKFLDDSTIDDDSAYEEGVKQFKVSANDIYNLLKGSKDLRENCITGVSNSSDDGASGIQHSSLAATREELYRSADIIFSGNPHDREYFLGQGTDSEKKVTSKYGSLKPCIIGSDAHSLDDVCIPDLNRFTWIKADSTYEGLKQIIYEPELRVIIQEDNPEQSEPYAKIGRMNLDLPDDLMIQEKGGEKSLFCLHGDYDISFSNNLTCIIGGRGSGKSTIIHTLFNSWINHDDDKLSQIDSPLESLVLSPTSYIEMRDRTDVDVPARTEFFFQNEVEKSAKNINSMTILIGQRLERLSSLEDGLDITDLRNEWNMALSEFDDLIKAHEFISLTKKEISEMEKEAETLSSQTQIIQSDEYKKLLNELDAFSKGITKNASYVLDVEGLTTRIVQIINFIELLEWEEDQGKEELASFKKILIAQQQILNDKSKAVQTKFNENKYAEKLENKKKELKSMLGEKGISEENIAEITGAKEIIESTLETINNKRKEMKPSEEILKRKTEIISRYADAYSGYKKRFEIVTTSLTDRLQGMPIADNEIDFEIFVDPEIIKSRVVDYVQNEIAESTKSDSIRNLLFDGTEINDLIDDRNKITEQVTQYTGAQLHKELLRNYISDDAKLINIHLQIIKQFYDYSNIRIQTKLGSKLLQNTSFGERCGIVLAIIIAAGTNPIVIDQPEDNLDGHFISNVLVPLIRKQKKNRQIIMITRDANIAIGADAELIHIMNCTDGYTHISSATIENLGIRSEYIWILDGGEVAFKKREEKYNIG